MWDIVNSNPMGIGLGKIDYVWDQHKISRKILKWIPPHQIFMWDTKKISNPMGIGLGIDYVHMEENPKMDSPHIKIFMWGESHFRIFQSYGT